MLPFAHGVLPLVNGNLNARVNACIINAVITRPWGLVGIPLNGPMLLQSFYSNFSVGGRVGFVALVGIPLKGPMLLRSFYSHFSIGSLDSPERYAVTINSCHCVFVAPVAVPGA